MIRFAGDEDNEDKLDESEDELGEFGVSDRRLCGDGDRELESLISDLFLIG